MEYRYSRQTCISILKNLVINLIFFMKVLSLIKNKGEKALAMLVLCQRFETKVEQRAAQVAVTSELSSSIKEPLTNLQTKVETKAKKIHDISDEDDIFIPDLEEKEVKRFGKRTKTHVGKMISKFSM